MLRNARFDVWRPIRVNLDPSGAEGAAVANRYALSAMLSLEEELPPEHRRPVAALAAMTIEDYLSSRPRRKGRAGMPVVLVFDQFEEILTVAPRDVEEKRAFFEGLGQALDGGRHWALFCIREDYLGALAPYRQYLPTQLSNTFRLDLLSLEGAAEAAGRLAAQGGRAFPGLGQLIHDLSEVKVQQGDGGFVTEPGLHVEPVYLQVVCRRLWEAMPPDADRIEADDVTRYAEVSKALGGYYDEAVGRVAAGNLRLEREIRDWIGTRLVVGGIRSQVRQEPERTAGLDNRLVRQLLDSYVVRTEQRAGANWYELSHDRLVEPVATANEAWEADHLHPLQVQARLWLDARRTHALLASGAALRAAAPWLEENDALLTADERDFVGQSRRAREAELWGRRRLVAVAVGFALLSLAATATGAWAYGQKRIADLASQAAREAGASAQADAKIARLRQGDAERATLRAEVAQRRAQAAEKQAGEDRREAELKRREAERATAEASMERANAYAAKEDAETSLEKARNSARRLAVGRLHGDSVRMAAFLVNYTRGLDPSGWWREAATWVIEHPSSMARLPGGARKWRRPTFSPDGSVLALATEGAAGSVSLWRYGDTAAPMELPGASGAIRAMGFSPDGRWLAAAVDPGGLAVWDLTKPLPAPPARTDTHPIWDLAFDPSAKRLVAGGLDGDVDVWSTDGWPAPTRVHVAPGQRIWAVDTADSHWLAASGDGVVHVQDWEGLGARNSAHVKFCGLNSMTDAVFRPGKDELLMFGASPVIHRWLFLSDKPCATITAKREIREARYSPSGARMLIVERGADGGTHLIQNDDGSSTWPPPNPLETRTSLLVGAVMATFEPVSGDHEGTALGLAGGGVVASIVELDKRERPARRITLSGHAAPVQEVAFGARGGVEGGVFVATADADGELRVWRHTEDGLHHSALEEESRYYQLNEGGIAAGEPGRIRVTGTPADRKGPRPAPLSLELPIPAAAAAADAASRDRACPDMEPSDRAHYEEEHIRPVSARYCDPAGRFIATLSTNGTVRFWPHYSDDQLTARLRDVLGDGRCVKADLELYLPNDPAAWPSQCGSTPTVSGGPGGVASQHPSTPDPTPTAAEDGGAAAEVSSEGPPIDYAELRDQLYAQYLTASQAPPPASVCGCAAAPRSRAWVPLGVLVVLVRRRR